MFSYYVLLLCRLMCVTPPELQAEFLDHYTADGVVSRVIQDRDTQQRVNTYLQKFRIRTQLSELLLRRYIRQLYIHSAQDTRQQPDHYIESALKLVISTEECNSVFNYVLGFELIKLMFQMSWSQHERLYRLQITQEAFINTYIKPIQYTHRLNGIIAPKDERRFFAKRGFYIQKPKIHDKRLVELVMATFTASTVADFGFSIICHANFFHFDYDYIYAPEQRQAIFS